MHYVEMLERLHAAVRPEVYLEIGVGQGHSLAISRARTVAVDPNAQLQPEALRNKPWVKIFRMASDDFFRGEHAATTLEGHALDLAFIDGLHEFAQVVRDFENIERWGHQGTIVVIDDVLPRNAREASRAWHDGAWTGDVWRIVPFLREQRPDLRCTLVDVWEAGALIVSDLNPDHPGLAELARRLDRDFPGDGPAYERLVEAWIAQARPEPAEVALKAHISPPTRFDSQPELRTAADATGPLETSRKSAGASVTPPARARRRRTRARR